MTGPFMSGVLATVAQGCSNGKSDYRLGWINPALYAMARDNLGFTDITTGKNMSFGYGGYEAKIGHDLASGLGTLDPKSFPVDLCAYVSKTPRDIYFKSVNSTPSPTPTATKETVKAITISCYKGRLLKKVTGVKPNCPKGYKKK